MKKLTFIKNYRPHNWDVAHLYEHVLIAHIKNHLEKAGFVPDIDLFILADTYSGFVIKLSAVFYNEDAIGHFKELLSTTVLPTQKQILLAVQEIESEEVCKVDFDISTIRKKLRKLYQYTWSEIKAFEEPDEINHKDVDYIKSTPALENFNGLQVTISLPKDTYENSECDDTIFNRLSVNLVDTICDNLRKETSAYCKSSESFNNNGSIGVEIGLMIPTKFSHKAILNIIKNSVSITYLRPKYESIKNHILEWSKSGQSQTKEAAALKLDDTLLDFLLSNVEIDAVIHTPTSQEVKRWAEIKSKS